MLGTELGAGILVRTLQSCPHLKSSQATIMWNFFVGSRG